MAQSLGKPHWPENGSTHRLDAPDRPGGAGPHRRPRSSLRNKPTPTSAFDRYGPVPLPSHASRTIRL